MNAPRNARDMLYDLKRSEDRLYRLMRRCTPGLAAGHLIVEAQKTLARTQSLARTWPMDVTGL